MQHSYTLTIGGGRTRAHHRGGPHGYLVDSAPADRATHASTRPCSNTTQTGSSRLLPGTQNEYESVTFGEDEQR